MITLELGRDRPWGVFDQLPDGFASAATFADTLVGSARQHHGHAYRVFLEGLTRERAEDEAKLISYIRRKVAQIVQEAEAHDRGRYDPRVAAAFGIVFAAGLLAKRYGVLPRGMRMLPAVEKAYRLHQASRETVASPIDKLLALVRSDKLLDLRGTRDDATAADVAAAHGIIKCGNNGHELILTREHMRLLTDNPNAFMKNPDVRRAAVREGGHNMVHRQLPGLHQGIRYYVFKIDILMEYLRS